MMKYGLLVSRTLGNGTVSGWKNIGDYIQSLAAAQFMSKIDEYYDKTGDDSGTDTIKMIMNAWYIWDPEKFPISKRIIPLPVSMHISPVCADRLLSINSVVSWFKEHEPIGCRDKETEQLLKSKGVNSYFSACLTLTLGKKYKFKGEREKIIFVDPYLSSARKELSTLELVNTVLFGLVHLKTAFAVHKKIKHYYCVGRLLTVKKFIYASILIKTYSKLFSFKDLSEADYITHIVKVGDGSKLQTEEEKMKYAEKLVRIYSSAKLVVTGRIHCALPCLGVETPVIFTVGHTLVEGSEKSSAGRFGGLIDFFNVAKISKLKINYDFQFPIKNKELYKTYADDLSRKCEEFMND